MSKEPTNEKSALRLLDLNEKRQSEKESESQKRSELIQKLWEQCMSRNPEQLVLGFRYHNESGEPEIGVMYFDLDDTAFALVEAQRAHVSETLWGS